MDLQQLKYAIEVYKCGSISRAAEKLYMNQPNLSRIIMNLENEYGIVLFQRTAGGVSPTKDGEAFLVKAQALVAQSEDFDNEFKNHSEEYLSFKISLPRASYITYAFSKTLADFPVQKSRNIYFMETNNEDIIESVSVENYDAGVIRFPIELEYEYKRLLTERQLQFQEILTFNFVVLMSKSHPLAGLKEIHFSDLRPYTALVHGDLYSPLVSDRETERFYGLKEFKNKINLFERGSQFDFLENIPGTFMLVSPIPKEMLERYDLTQISISRDDMGLFEDLLITRKNRRYTDFEQSFLHHLLDTERDIRE